MDNIKKEMLTESQNIDLKTKHEQVQMIIKLAINKVRPADFTKCRNAVMWE